MLKNIIFKISFRFSFKIPEVYYPVIDMNTYNIYEYPIQIVLNLK